MLLALFVSAVGEADFRNRRVAKFALDVRHLLINDLALSSGMPMLPKLFTNAFLIVSVEARSAVSLKGCLLVKGLIKMLSVFGDPGLLQDFFLKLGKESLEIVILDGLQRCIACLVNNCPAIPSESRGDREHFGILLQSLLHDLRVYALGL